MDELEEGRSFVTRDNRHPSRSLGQAARNASAEDVAAASSVSHIKVSTPTLWDYAHITYWTEMVSGQWVHNATFFCVGYDPIPMIVQQPTYHYSALLQTVGSLGWEAFHVECYNGVFTIDGIERADAMRREILLKKPQRRDVT